MTTHPHADDTEVSPCSGCGEPPIDITGEQLKAVTDRLDLLNGNIQFLCQTVHAVMQSIPGFAGTRIRKTMDTQRQAPHGH